MNRVCLLQCFGALYTTHIYQWSALETRFLQETGFLNLDIALLETAFMSKLVFLRATSKLAYLITVVIFIKLPDFTKSNSSHTLRIITSDG
jgi:hypothetical protein